MFFFFKFTIFYLIMSNLLVILSVCYISDIIFFIYRNFIIFFIILMVSSTFLIKWSICIIPVLMSLSTYYIICVILHLFLLIVFSLSMVPASLHSWLSFLDIKHCEICIFRCWIICISLIVWAFILVPC